MTLIVHPDVDQLAVTYFTNTLAAQGHTQHVGKKVPAKSRPDRFMRVYSNGGPDESLIATRAQVVAQLYDIDGPRCAQTANLVAALGKAAVGFLFDSCPYVARAKSSVAQPIWTTRTSRRTSAIKSSSNGSSEPSTESQGIFTNPIARVGQRGVFTMTGPIVAGPGGAAGDIKELFSGSPTAPGITGGVFIGKPGIALPRLTTSLSPPPSTVLT